jgi:hypothetical protein
MITTYSTTHDLDDYYAQLKQIPRLSDEEQHHLLTALAQPPQAQGMSALDDTGARHRLIEGHLTLATYLTLHDSDPPITGNEDTLYTLSYECYRGYTIYRAERGRCCIHGKQGCLRLRGKFVCFPDIEDAKNLIKRFRADGYTSYDSVERYLPEWEYVCLNWRELQGPPSGARPMQRVS